jgi:hypothetical protein
LCEKVAGAEEKEEGDTSGEREESPLARERKYQQGLLKNSKIS